MPIEPVTIWGYCCRRCGHKWVPREFRQPGQPKGDPRAANDPGEKPGEPEEPRVCPSCKSAWWNVPKKKAREPERGPGTPSAENNG